MNSSSTKNNTFCYDLPIAVGNSTFCGLTEKWSPRFSEGRLLAMTSIPVLIYWIILFKMIKKLYKTIIESWQKHIDETTEEYWAQNPYQYLEGVELLYKEEKWADGVNCSCRYYFKNYISNLLASLRRSNEVGFILRAKSYFSLVVLVLVKYFWDAIDLTLDVYIFYRLERGDILDAVIHRNDHVNDSIYAFAILGCLPKILAWKLYQSLAKQSTEGEYLSYAKNIIVLVGFLFEDGPELILEYFYVEKYITSYTTLMVAKDCMITFLLVQTAIKTMAYCLREYKERNHAIQILIINVIVLFSVLSSILRVAGSLYQYITKKLRRSCFEITEGRLLQTPFDSECMRGIDYAVFVTSLVPLSVLLILISMFFVMLVKVLVMIYKRNRTFVNISDEEVNFVTRYT
uniref:Uncharacterized protein n=1 Tax=Clytia hemisphaerica TaxID=252671 RepID=A0A7M5X9E2_9CNID|eukprot:TCONS_00051201-protein